MMAWDACLVAAGGFLGAVCRFYVGILFERHFSSTFPYGTLTINLTGSFAVGGLAGILQGSYMSFYFLAAIGFLGAFTTFSAMNLESLLMFRDKRWKSAILYLGVSYIAGISLAYAGYILGCVLQV